MTSLTEVKVSVRDLLIGIPFLVSVTLGLCVGYGWKVQAEDHFKDIDNHLNQVDKVMAAHDDKLLWLIQHNSRSSEAPAQWRDKKVREPEPDGDPK